MNLQLALLEKAAREDRLAHLLLFHGESALHQREEAIRLAQILNCSHQFQERPCQICVACRKISSGNHPDVLWLTPNKMTLGIEQVLGWQEKLYLKLYEGNYRISIIEQADSLTLPAANALLKVIEEPPDKTLIILCAVNAESILPTIRSRAQIIYFPDNMSERLQACREESKSQENDIALQLSNNNYNLATEIIEQGVCDLQNWLEQFWRSVNEKDFLGLFSLFPVDKKQASLYLQVMAAQVQKEMQQDSTYSSDLLAVGKAINALRQQANPRLVIEVLALELFQRRGFL
jgi:DNA polymerase-3 subunit delta'